MDHVLLLSWALDADGKPCPLIRVIVFIVAMISVPIINNCILKQGDDEFLCATRRLLGGLSGLHLALPYPLPLVSHGKEHSGLQLLCHVFSLADRVAGGLFPVSSQGGSYLTLFSTPFFLQAREEVTHEPDIASINKANSHVACRSKGRNASLLASSSYTFQLPWSSLLGSPKLRALGSNKAPTFQRY